MSIQGYYNPQHVGEWNGPQSGPPPPIHNGYPAMNGVMDGQIGMFQLPQNGNGAQQNFGPSSPDFQPGQMQPAYPIIGYQHQRGMIPGNASDPQLALRGNEYGNPMYNAVMNGIQQMNINGYSQGPPMHSFVPQNGIPQENIQYGDTSKPVLTNPPPYEVPAGNMPPSHSDPALYQMMQPQQPTINFENYENIPVHVRGDQVLPPIDTFREANFSELVQVNVDMSGYVKPTPVQKNAIPSLLAGRDLMACAQTGSGKTAAFLLPIINNIVTAGLTPYEEMNPHIRRSKQFPYALILSPTRELAMQIHKEAQKFCFRTNVLTAMFYGGRENYREQLNKCRYGCHIIIATPGRLIDVVNQQYVSLERCQFLVLDEADRMLDMGFEPQIRKIVSLGLPDKMARQTAMFSATFPNEIKKLAEDFLKPNFIHMAVGRIGSTSENIEQTILWVDEHEKRGHLRNLLDNEDRGALILVFVETRRAANDLSFQLQGAGHRAVAIHGDLKQPDRERNLEMFKNGSNPILVATAVAARGLDIPNVKHVINYDMPNDVDEYVHRIGRTGRCGNQGQATSFFAEKNKALARELMAVLNESNQSVPDWLPPVAAQPPSQRNNKFMRGGRGGTRGNFGMMNGGNRFPQPPNQPFQMKFGMMPRGPMGPPGGAFTNPPPLMMQPTFNPMCMPPLPQQMFYGGNGGNGVMYGRGNFRGGMPPNRGARGSFNGNMRGGMMPNNSFSGNGQEWQPRPPVAAAAPVSN
ncbi:unnamed protein product, partial [Mesorhabditis spiculigera]